MATAAAESMDKAAHDSLNRATERALEWLSKALRNGLKNGRFRTWPDRENDGALWRDGERIGRVYRRHDGRWQWFPQIGDCKTGACGGKEVAKAELERRAALFPVNNR